MDMFTVIDCSNVHVHVYMMLTNQSPCFHELAILTGLQQWTHKRSQITNLQITTMGETDHVSMKTLETSKGVG